MGETDGCTGSHACRDRPTPGAAAAVVSPPMDALIAASARALAAGDALGALQGVALRDDRIGQARARRWLAPPLVDFTSILLLPASLPGA